MRRAAKTGSLIVLALGAALLVPAPTAAADGFGASGLVAWNGVVSPNGGTRYVTRDSDGHTIVLKVDTDNGIVRGSRMLPGIYNVPAVAYDGSPTGLSADGATLALVRTPSSVRPKHTSIRILDTRNLKVRESITLDGPFSVDAISPDGKTLYLIQYLSRIDPTRYAVRAYDVGAGRLEPKPIVDPSEHEGEMRGLPITRVMSLDGRWAYTLYDGNGETPFIHALDTGAGRAKCIDLDPLSGMRQSRLFQLHLAVSPDGGTVSVLDSDEPIALVNPATFAVSLASTLGTSSGGSSGTDIPWTVIALAGLALLAATAAIVRRRRLAST